MAIAMRAEPDAELKSHDASCAQETIWEALDGGADDAALAEILLSDFDAEYRAAAASEGARGRGGARTADEWARSVPREPLAAAVLSLCSAKPAKGLVLLGICADDAETGVAALKAWVSALQLPRGLLYNADTDGVPRDLSGFGPVYIKYNSVSGAAHLDRCPGQFRGVLFTPDLMDGVFRQYGFLPLELLEECFAAGEQRPIAEEFDI
jgi:hypothetical protein